MARRKQFQQLVTAVRAELKQSTEPAAGAGSLAPVKQALQRHYETLWDEYDWPHLDQMFDRVLLSAGQRYYEFDDLDFDRVYGVVVWYNGQPTPLNRGITFEDYAQFVSDEDERSDPPIKWDVRFRSTKEMIEIWPIPAASDVYIQFHGRLRFRQLVDDSDLCLLDDHLVVLRAAASLAPAKERADIQRKMADAEKRLSTVKARAREGSSDVRMGLGRVGRPVYGKSVVRVSGG